MGMARAQASETGTSGTGTGAGHSLHDAFDDSASRGCDSDGGSLDGSGAAGEARERLGGNDGDR